MIFGGDIKYLGGVGTIINLGKIYSILECFLSAPCLTVYIYKKDN